MLSFRAAARTDCRDTVASYVPRDQVNKAASLTLEYAYDDWAVGTLAGLLGNASDAALFHNRSLSYRNVWSATTSFMCPRLANGVRLQVFKCFFSS